MGGRTLTRIAICGLAAALAAACANANVITIAPEDWEVMQLRQSLSDRERVDQVGLPLLASAAPHCGSSVWPTLGARFANPSSFMPMERQAAQTVLGADDRLQAVTVVERLAGSAGLHKGDILLNADGAAAPTGEYAADEWKTRSEQLMRREQAIDIAVLRAGQEIPLQLPVTPVCRYRLDVWSSGDIFARTTGAEINVTRGLLLFAHTDQELAVVLSHELAHNLLGHPGLSPSSSLAAASTARLPMERELEADYVGLYLMAAAGMDITGADEIWRRLRDTFPDSANPADPSAAASHPTHAARLAAFRDWIAEIKAKQAQGLPLTPEKKDWGRLLALYSAAP